MENKDIKMHLKFDEVWTYYLYNKIKLIDEAVLVAENIKTKYKIYITNEDNGLTFIVEDENEKEIYFERGLTYFDTESTLREIIEDYLEEESIEDVVDAREDDMRGAMYDCLSVLLMDKECPMVDFESIYGEKIVDEMLEATIEYLIENYEAIIYRPMIFEDKETGLQILIEYPYEAEKNDSTVEVVEANIG